MAGMIVEVVDMTVIVDPTALEIEDVAEVVLVLLKDVEDTTVPEADLGPAKAKIKGFLI